MQSWPGNSARFTRFTRSEIAPVQAPADPDIQVVGDAETLLDPPTKVLLHNDDVTPYDFVIFVMQHVFEFSWPEAEAVTLTAHVQGVALVGVYPLEDAKYRVGEAHRLARSAGYPLTLTIESEESG